MRYVSSLKHDVRLVRESKGIPKQVNIYGYVYDIDTDELSLVVEDKAQASSARHKQNLAEATS